jgi:rRNA-processing protein FCF1
MIPIQFNVDIFTELQRLGYDEFIVPQAVVNELKMLAKRSKGMDKTAAKVALSLSERCKIVEETGVADDVIVRLAEDIGSAVLTNDIELKNRLYKKGIITVYLRQRNRLEIA